MTQKLFTKMESEEKNYDNIYINESTEIIRSCSPLQSYRNSYTGVLTIIDENTLANNYFKTYNINNNNNTTTAKKDCCATDSTFAETKCFNTSLHANFKKCRTSNDAHVVSRNKLEKKSSNEDNVKEINMQSVALESYKDKVEKENINGSNSKFERITHEEINEILPCTNNQNNCLDTSKVKINYLIARRRLERFVEMSKTCNTTSTKSCMICKRRRSLAALYAAAILIK